MAEIVSKTTIRDVARTAGVSVGSVSRALNGGKNVSARVARDVAAAAEKLGYQPDFLARSLRTRTTSMVGCLVSDLANPLYASIVQAAEARLREAGLLMVVGNTANDPAREGALVAAFRSRRLDGMLVAPGSDENDRTWRELASGGAPVVILDRDVPQQENTPWPAVLVDHREGARTATRYLIGLGHRRIALLTPGARMRPGRERIAGFKAAFAEADIDPAGAEICLQESSMDFAQGDALALLRRDRRPTAIIALGTRILAGALRAARDLGLSVPADLSVIAVGDTDLAAVHSPALSALRWIVVSVGRGGCGRLLPRLRGASGEGQSRALLPVDLVLRDSCAPPREK